MREFKKFKSISFKKRTKCMVCGIKLDEPIIVFPDFPLTEIYVNEKVTEKVGFVDQSFCLCGNCGHAQITNIINPEILYDNSYHFRTSTSTTAVKVNDDFLFFINRITGNRRFDTIIEIGCSDVYLLNSLRSRSDELIGVDPTLKGRENELSDDKITVIGDFFENIDLNNYMHGDNTLILCSHTLEHLDDPKAILKGLLDNANDNTLLFFQFPGFETLIDNCRFDQIFHQHLHYFSLHSFTYLLNELDGELIDFNVNYHHWGTLLVAFKKARNKNVNSLLDTNFKKVSHEKILKNYELFKGQMDVMNKYLETIKGEKIYGYGAALMLPVLSYHLKNDFSTLDSIIDDDKNKEGLSYINLPISIKTPENICLKDATVVITAIDNSRNILPKVISLNPKRIILPISNI